METCWLLLQQNQGWTNPGLHENPNLIPLPALLQQQTLTLCGAPNDDDDDGALQQLQTNSWEKPSDVKHKNKKTPLSGTSSRTEWRLAFYKQCFGNFRLLMTADKIKNLSDWGGNLMKQLLNYGGAGKHLQSQEALKINIKLNKTPQMFRQI